MALRSIANCFRVAAAHVRRRCRMPLHLKLPEVLQTRIDKLPKEVGDSIKDLDELLGPIRGMVPILLIPGLLGWPFSTSENTCAALFHDYKSD